MSLLLLGSGPGGSGDSFSDPSDISGLVAWWGMNDASTVKRGGVPVTSGDVDTWEDQSGNAYHFISDSADPAYSAGAFNSTDAVYFDSNEKLHTGAGNHDFDFSRDDPFTIAVTFEPAFARGSNVALLDRYTNPSGWVLYYLTTGEIYFAMYQNGGAASIEVKSTSTVSPGASSETRVIFTYSGSGAASGVKILWNGSTDTPVTVADDLTADWAPFSHDFHIQDLRGRVRQLIIYNVELSGTDLTDLDGWLATDGGF